MPTFAEKNVLCPLLFLKKRAKPGKDAKNGQKKWANGHFYKTKVATKNPKKRAKAAPKWRF